MTDKNNHVQNLKGFLNKVYIAAAIVIIAVILLFLFVFRYKKLFLGICIYLIFIVISVFLSIINISNYYIDTLNKDSRKDNELFKIIRNIYIVLLNANLLLLPLFKNFEYDFSRYMKYMPFMLCLIVINCYFMFLVNDYFLERPYKNENLKFFDFLIDKNSARFFLFVLITFFVLFFKLTATFLQPIAVFLIVFYLTLFAVYKVLKNTKKFYE